MANPLSSQTSNPNELLVSVNPCCFNLAENGEKMSTFEISNKNGFPLFFKLMATNAHAMNFHPSCGRLTPYGVIKITGYHVQSARPIGYQQKVAIMTSRLPLDEWPEQHHYLPQPPSKKQSSIHSKSFSPPQPPTGYPSAHFARYEHDILKKFYRRSPTAAQTRPQSAAQARPQSAAQTRPQSAAQTRPQSAAQARPQSAAQARPQSAAQARPQSAAKTIGSSTSHRQDRDVRRKDVEVEAKVEPKRVDIFCHCSDCRDEGEKRSAVKKSQAGKKRCRRRLESSSDSATDSPDYSDFVTMEVKHLSSSSSDKSFRSFFQTDDRLCRLCDSILTLTRYNFLLILILLLIIVISSSNKVLSYVWPRQNYSCYRYPWLLHNFCGT